MGNNTIIDSKKPYKGIAMEGVIAQWYARITDKESRHVQLAERLVEKIPPGSRVLEIAPGPGYFSIELARRGDYQITGLDISKSFVEIAQKNARLAGAAIDFRHGNASDMPFPDESFDFTFCQAAFKNFTEPVKAIAEMYRVLRPKGTSVINDLRSDAPDAEIVSEVDRMQLSAVNRFMTLWTFRSFLLKNAHSVTEMEAFVEQTPFPKYHVDTDGIGFSLWMEK
jgi:ubiquinone/menaquinone biosynthesis C-methylase UbiE